MTCGRHVEAGVYVLGAMDDAEATAFEQHLAGCGACGVELDALMEVESALAELSAGLPDAAPAHEVLTPPGPELLDRVLGDVRTVRRRRRLFLVAAAVVLVAAGPLITLGVTGHHHEPVSQTVSAAAPHGIHATVAMTDTTWGTSVNVTLAGVRGPLTCELVAVGKDGTRQTTSTWSVAGAGYGVPGSPERFTVWGATGLHRAEIDHFDVSTSDGRLLARIGV